MTNEITTDSYQLPKRIKELVDKCNYRNVLVVQAILSGEYSSNTAAYISVYGDAAYESAKESESTILTNPNLEELLAELRKAHIIKNLITREEAMEVLSDMAKTEMGDIIEFGDLDVGEDENGDPVVCGTWRFRGSKDLTKAVRRSIHEVSSSTQGLKIKQHDQKAAIKLLAEMLGWNEAKKVDTGTDYLAYMKQLQEGMNGGVEETRTRDEA